MYSIQSLSSPQPEIYIHVGNLIWSMKRAFSGKIQSLHHQQIDALRPHFNHTLKSIERRQIVTNVNCRLCCLIPLQPREQPDTSQTGCCQASLDFAFCLIIAKIIYGIVMQHCCSSTPVLIQAEFWQDKVCVHVCFLQLSPLRSIFGLFS